MPAFWGCEDDRCDQIRQYADIEVSISIERLEDQLIFERYEDVLSFLVKHRTLADYFSLRPFCPEVSIGLGIPREPIRLVKDSKRQKCAALAPRMLTWM